MILFGLLQRVDTSSCPSAASVCTRLALAWELWEARIAGQRSGKRNATGKILDKNRERRKMKSVSKYKERK